MKAEMKTDNEWKTFLDLYATTHRRRPTRLGVFENVDNISNDYWLESGLGLEGIDLDHTNGMTNIQLMFGSFTHVVSDATELKLIFTKNGLEDGLDIRAADGSTTLLRFEAGR